MTSHGSLNYHNPLHYLKKFIILNFLINVARNARGVHVLSQLGYTHFRRLMPTWHGATLVMYHPIQAPNLSEVAPLSRTDFGIPPDGFLFLYLGRLDVYTKGLDILMKAFSRVSAGGTARLALVGPDWLGGQAQLQELAETLRCADRVHFTGPQYGAKKWAALRLADVFVAPSRWDAGPVALLEALGVGAPAITSTAVNPAEELVEHDAVYLCSPTVRALANAMGALMSNAALRKRLGAKAEEWVRHDCSQAVVGQALVRFYEEALAGNPGRL
jgi:glycosyltransferase involved in cell wall biosynthesis